MSEVIINPYRFVSAVPDCFEDGTDSWTSDCGACTNNFLGQKIDAGSARIGTEITELSFFLALTQANADVTMEFGVYDDSASTFNALGTFNSSSLSTSFQKLTVTGSAITIAVNDILYAKNNSAFVSSRKLKFQYDTSAPAANEHAIRYAGSWIDDFSGDLNYCAS